MQLPTIGYESSYICMMQSVGNTAEQSQRKTVAISARARLACVFAIWLALIGYGFTTIIRYDTKEGEFGKPCMRWPTNDLIPNSSNEAQFIMFIDPKCSCTRAALAELLTTFGRTTLPCAKHFVFFSFADSEFGTAEAKYRDMIKLLADAKCYFDVDGELVRKFGVQTSSHVLFYASSGELIFSGGITGSRGNEGENTGRELLEDRLNGLNRDYAEHPVFGCSLVVHQPRLKQEVSR